ncbi:Prolyl oligopeptidase-like protein [Forsythia ovata]|uniref:Prolyl oligopeptidase-like protein n=1 Tax=Forsythia ovata TaxID=205694 RepID=A0ABD1SI87_9LAMI
MSSALVDNFEASYDHVANDDSVFTFQANKKSPKYKLVRVDMNDPTSWTDVLDENEKDVLGSAVAVNGNQMVVNYLSDRNRQPQRQSPRAPLHLRTSSSDSNPHIIVQIEAQD